MSFKVTLKQRVENHLKEVMNNEKHHKNGVPIVPERVTGRSLFINEVDNLTVIDIDIKKDTDEIIKEMFRECLLMNLPETAIVVKTGSGGLHIYANTDKYTNDKARKVKACDYDITVYEYLEGVDILSSFEPNAPSQVIYAGTVSKTGTYEFIQNDDTFEVVDNVLDILEALNFTLKVPITVKPIIYSDEEPVFQEVEDIVEQDIPKEDLPKILVRRLIDGIKNFEIHGTSSPNIEEEVSLFTLFTGINALPDENLEEAYSNAFNKCTHTDSALKSWKTCRKRYSNTHNIKNLIKIIKIHNTEYYEKFVHKLLKQKFFNDESLINDIKERREELEKWDFNLNSGFCIDDVRRNFPYKSMGDAIADLKKVFVVIITSPETYILKDPADDDNESGILKYNTIDSVRKILSTDYIGEVYVNNNLRKYSLWDLYLDNKVLFSMKRLTFYNENPGSFNIFRGYKIKQLEHVNETIIEPFLNHIHDVIADKNEEVYKYILLWIASVLQKPSFKTQVVLVLLGKQGSGKGVFTSVICKLMSQYANENVEKIEDIVGSFNAILENKKLVVLNEFKSIDVNKYFDSECLKSLISDPTMTINEKFEHKRKSSNVLNFMMCSNNRIPVNIEDKDRRYMVTETSPSKCGDFNYFDNLLDQFTPTFYENLFTYFMIMNLKGFDSRKIPRTKAKETIREASMSPYELFVRDMYKRIKDISGPDLFDLYREFVERNNYKLCSSKFFIAQIKEFTGDSHQKKIGGKNTKVYSLLPEYVQKFKEYHDEVCEEFSEEEEDANVAEMI